MKKPFKETKIGQALAVILPALAKKLPVIGALIENHQSADGGVGTIQTGKAWNDMIRLAIFGFMLFEYYRGNLSIEAVLHLFGL
jgi:hypothetical protein